MNDASQAVTGMLGLWLMVQLAAMLALLLGGLYALYCLSRAASGLERLAETLERWAAREEAGGGAPITGAPLPGALLSDAPMSGVLRPMPVPIEPLTSAESLSSAEPYTAQTPVEIRKDNS